MSTYYTPQAWADGPAGNTPVTAATQLHVESGLGSAHDRIDALTVGSVLIPTAIRTTATAPAAGQLVTYDASSNPIGPIPLPAPSAGVIMSVVKGDATTNTVTLTSGVLLGNGGSTSIVLRTVGEARALYGSASGWFVSGAHSPIVGTTAGTVAAGDDARFANTLTTSLYGGPSRTVAPVCEARYTGAAFNVGAADLYAQGGWTAQVDTDSMLGTVGSYSVINIPVAGRYICQYHSLSQTGGGVWTTNSRITLNHADYRWSIAADVVGTQNNQAVVLNAITDIRLAAGDQLYWANFISGGGVATISAAGVGVTGDFTHINVRYVGPV